MSKNTRLELPQDRSLPFFSYGIFKPGELGFLQLKDVIDYVVYPCEVAGYLLDRDTLPIYVNSQKNGISGKGRERVSGALIYFCPEKREEAYEKISRFEPQEHYEWKTVKLCNKSSDTNILQGIDEEIEKGTIEVEEKFITENDAGEKVYSWDSSTDPYFSQGLPYIKKCIKMCKQISGKASFMPIQSSEVQTLFHLQMFYMFLWVIIERYFTYRYGLTRKATQPAFEDMSKDPAFIRALEEHLQREDTLFKASQPSNGPFILNKDNPFGCLKYYKEARNNTVHRGKSSFDRDKDILEKSLYELSFIFSEVYDDAKRQSQTMACQFLREICS